MLQQQLGIPVVESAMPFGTPCVGCGDGLGIITTEVTSTLGGVFDKRGAGTVLGVHWSIWATVAGFGAAAGATTGYLVAKPKKKLRGSLIGATGGAVGGLAALAILSQL